MGGDQLKVTELPLTEALRFCTALGATITDVGDVVGTVGEVGKLPPVTNVIGLEVACPSVLMAMMSKSYAVPGARLDSTTEVLLTGEP
jgi:hypothetical protein